MSTLLDSYSAKLRPEHKKAPGKEFYRQVIESGFSIDRRPLSDDDIRSIYDSTIKNVLKKQVVLKIRVGDHHQRQDPELKGFVKRLELRQATGDELNRLSIWATFHLYPEIAKSYAEGRFPEVSIGPTERAIDQDGNDQPTYLDHIAICGAQNAALPWLKQAADDFRAAFRSVINRFKSTKSKKGNRQMEIPEEDLMAFMELMNQGADIFVKMQEMMAQWLPEMAQDVPEDDAKGKKEDDDDMKTQQTAKMSRTEALEQYTTLLEKREISPSDKAAFLECAEGIGINYALRQFAKPQKNAPPKTEPDKSVKSDTSELTKGEIDKEVERQFMKMGKTAEQIKSMRESLLNHQKNGKGLVYGSTDRS